MLSSLDDDALRFQVVSATQEEKEADGAPRQKEQFHHSLCDREEPFNEGNDTHRIDICSYAKNNDRCQN